MTAADVWSDATPPAAPVDNDWNGLGALPPGERPPAGQNATSQPQRDDTIRLPPHDVEAERQVLGGCILDPRNIADVDQIITDNDWYRPAPELIWSALVDLDNTGQPVEPAAVMAHLQATGTLGRVGGAPYLFGLIEGTASSSATYYARHVADHATNRRTTELGTWLYQAGHGGADGDLIRKRLELHLAQRGRTTGRHDIPTLDELLAQDEDDEPAWIIPGLLERQDRLIVTASEGAGKSTLLRQIAIMCASGLHPFRNTPMQPVSVLYVDLENSKRQVRRKIRGLRIQAGQRYQDERLRFEVRMQGLDLTDSTDVRWLDEAVRRYRPDLLITGPVYKLANGDPIKEEHSKPVVLAIDRMRAEHDVAVILEAHSAKAPAGVKHRPKEPYGWSGWLRWPEFGLHLAEDGEISHWRGQRDERDWPELLLRGGTWPWMPANSQTDDRWAQIHQCLTAAGERLSNREIGRRTGLDESAVRRLIDRNSRRFTALIQHFEEPTDD